ncbi:MAG: glycosyltransferase family 2 protein [Succinimonas sp.]|nr:glycosyltransferase family 2 protein [Succinimonas sp.]
MLGFITHSYLSKLSQGFKQAEDYVRKKNKRKKTLARELCNLAKEAYSRYPHEAIRVMEESNDLVPMNTKNKWIGFRLYDLGKIEEAYRKLSAVPRDAFAASSEQKKLERVNHAYGELVNNSKNNVNNNNKASGDKETYQIKKLREITEIAADIIVSDHQRWYKKSSCRIGAVCDEYFLKIMTPAASLTAVTPDNYEEVINEKKIDMLLVTSVWEGVNSAWDGIAIPSSFIAARAKAIEMLKQCKLNAIPVVFYSINGSNFFENFAELAKLADYVYTSSASDLDLYKNACTAVKHVEYLPMGINPLEHNPVGISRFKRVDNVLFCGLWINNNNKRCSELTSIFNGVVNSKKNLCIFCEKNIDNNGLSYPDSFKKYAAGYTDSSILARLNKSCEWGVAYADPVSGMVPYVIYEKLADACLVISNNCQDKLSSGMPLVFNAYNAEAIREYLNTDGKEDLSEREMFGVRSVMKNHTCFSIMNRILADASLEEKCVAPKLLVIGADSARNRENFKRQTYDNKYFVPCDRFDKELLREYDAVTWFDDNNYYQEFYLEDMMNAFKYTDCGFVTKESYFECQGNDFNLVKVTGIEHDYVSSFEDKSMTVFWRELFDLDKIAQLNNNNLSTDGEFKGDLIAEAKGYSADSLSLVKNYDAFVSRNKITLPPYQNYRVSVIIPVYNNGEELYAKAFASLARSAMFDRYEIIIADSGSSDPYTISVINWLSAKYNNVKTYLSSDKISVSQSRNIGMKMANGEYILFIESNDECVSDGYAKLWKESENEDFDVIIGNYYLKNDPVIAVDNHYAFSDCLENDIYECNEGLSKEDIEFSDARLHSMLIYNKFIKDSNLQTEDNELTADNLAKTILSRARRIKFSKCYSNLSRPHDDDRCNNACEYFDKLLTIQINRIKRLKDLHKFDWFMKEKFEDYAKQNIINRLTMVPENDYDSCRSIVKRIMKLYCGYYKGNDKQIQSFM